MSLTKKRKTVLLTGARGRLGSELRRLLPSSDLELVPFSRTRGEGIFELSDLLTPGLWEHADVILHAAWSTVPMVSERNAGAEWHHDFPLLLTLLQAAARRTPKPHFIFFSSGGSVYGNAGTTPSRETDSLRPIGWHGFAKAQAEALLQEFCAKADVPFAILRISNPYGFPSANDKPQGIIPILIQAALHDQCFRIWGDGLARKDFLHANDFAAAIRGIISGGVTGVFNLAHGESHTVKEIVETVEETLGRKVPLEHAAAYPWDVNDSRLDNSKLMNIIGWKPEVDVHEGVRLCVESFRRVAGKL